MPTISGPDDKTLDQRGERRIVTRFCDSRLAALFGQVWRRLPVADVDRIYTALGAGPRLLLVTDHNPANRPTRVYGHAMRVTDDVRVFLDFFNCSDINDKTVLYFAAHELAHVALGHLGAPRGNEHDLSHAGKLEVMRRVPPPVMTNYATAAEVPDEDAANALCRKWGYPFPVIGKHRRVGPRETISEWTATR